jgi:hypothetical protein
MSDLISSISTGEIVHGFGVAQPRYHAIEHNTTKNTTRCKILYRTRFFSFANDLWGNPWGKRRFEG